MPSCDIPPLEKVKKMPEVDDLVISGKNGDRVKFETDDK